MYQISLTYFVQASSVVLNAYEGLTGYLLFAGIMGVGQAVTGARVLHVMFCDQETFHERHVMRNSSFDTIWFQLIPCLLVQGCSRTTRSCSVAVSLQRSAPAWIPF